MDRAVQCRRYRRASGFLRPDAVNHQVVAEPLVGREAIRGMFATKFARARMVCVVEHLLEDDNWTVLEWSDPLG